MTTPTRGAAASATDGARTTTPRRNTARRGAPDDTALDPSLAGSAALATLAGPAAPAAPATPAGPATPAAPSKLARLIDLLGRPDGASLAEMSDATGWQAHSVRGALAGALKRKGHVVTSGTPDSVRRYRIATASDTASDTGSDTAAS